MKTTERILSAASVINDDRILEVDSYRNLSFQHAASMAAMLEFFPRFLEDCKKWSPHPSIRRDADSLLDKFNEFQKGQ